MSSPNFTMYSHASGPNGWKVAFLLEELGLSYETKFLDFGKGEHKAPDYINNYNPNGRIPTLIDHANNDFTLFETGAIYIYLSEKYDPKHILTPTDPNENYKVLQWLFFSSSGQGPYFGQATWFMYLAEEKPLAVQERYRNETLRVLGVLEIALKKSGSGYLLSKKSIADLSFVSWNVVALMGILPGFKNFDFEKDFPLTAKWHKDLVSSPAVARVLAVKESMKTH